MHRPSSLRLFAAALAAAGAGACADAAPATAPATVAAAPVNGTGAASGASGASGTPTPNSAGAHAADPSDTTTVPGAIWAPGAPGADSAGGLGRVADATVRALRGPELQEVARVTSANDGTFAFRALPGGLYTFEATPPASSGLLPTRMQDITVTRGQFGVMTIPGALAPSVPSTLSPFRALNMIVYAYATR